MYGKCVIERVLQIDEIYTLFEERFENDYIFEGETHNFWEFIAVVSGTPCVTAGKEVFSMSPGQIIFHPPMEFHNIRADKNNSAEIIVISFNGKVVPELSGKVFSMPSGSISVLKEIVESAQSCFVMEDINCRSMRPGAEIAAQELINKIELFILSVYSAGNTLQKKAQTQSAKNFTSIMKFLEDNIEKQLTVDDIAYACNMSRANLKKTFYRYAGVGIMHYFNNIKMLKAAELLSDGMSVKETALNLGYAEQNYFSAAFKRIMGKPPSEFR